MSDDPNRGDPKSGAGMNWEQRLRAAGANLEEEVRRAITYLNDDVVPEVRRGGSEALRVAAAELHKLAQKMDDHAGKSSSASSGTSSSNPDERK